MNIADILGAHIDVDMDTQPEKDLPRSDLIFQTVGLFAGCGLILGALPGALVGHFVVEDAFDLGLEGSIWIGAMTGAIAVAVLAFVLVRIMSSRIAEKELRQPAIAR